MNIRQIVEKANGTVNNQDVKCDGKEYMFSALFDEEEDADSFAENEFVSKSALDTVDGTLTLFFSIKGSDSFCGVCMKECPDFCELCSTCDDEKEKMRLQITKLHAEYFNKFNKAPTLMQEEYDYLTGANDNDCQVRSRDCEDFHSDG